MALLALKGFVTVYAKQAVSSSSVIDNSHENVQLSWIPNQCFKVMHKIAFIWRTQESKQ